jgi:hypothetical protein
MSAPGEDRESLFAPSPEAGNPKQPAALPAYLSSEIITPRRTVPDGRAPFLQSYRFAFIRSSVSLSIYPE